MSRSRILSNLLAAALLGSAVAGACADLDPDTIYGWNLYDPSFGNSAAGAPSSDYAVVRSSRDYGYRGYGNGGYGYPGYGYPGYGNPGAAYGAPGWGYPPGNAYGYAGYPGYGYPARQASTWGYPPFGYVTRAPGQLLYRNRFQAGDFQGYVYGGLDQNGDYWMRVRVRGPFERLMQQMLWYWLFQNRYAGR